MEVVVLIEIHILTLFNQEDLEDQVEVVEVQKLVHPKPLVDLEQVDKETMVVQVVEVAFQLKTLLLVAVVVEQVLLVKLDLVDQVEMVEMVEVVCLITLLDQV